jgi:glucose/arabinose dehydrogenase
MIAGLIAAAVVLTGPAALGDWTRDAPGVTRRITVKDMPPAGASRSGFAPPEVVKRPAGARLAVPAGFTVSEFARLQAPRQLRAAPNGDVFAAETEAGEIAVLRATDGAPKAAVAQTFAAGLDRPFGMAFFPPGPNPQWLYVANANAVVRFAYRNGDLKPRGPPEVIVPRLAASTRGHSTRDVVFSPDGRWMYVSVGSSSNDADDMPRKSPAEAKAYDAVHGLGAAWGEETDRADVLIMNPLGRGRRVLAAGLRNCVTVAVQPSGTMWCAVNERDGMGDDLPPDYVTRVRDHAFYGWPWFYLGDHPDPRHRGERPDLAGKVTTPDVLIQAHSAPLGMTFYNARSGTAAFPAAYQGDAFVALHGSWNRARRTGYKVVRVTLGNGEPTGSYQDFLTGFAGPQGVWGRPVGVAVAHDGALLVSDDGAGIVWRVAATARSGSAAGPPPPRPSGR